MIAAYLAVAIRFDGEIDVRVAWAFFPIVAILLLVRSAVGIGFGLYSRDWRSASTPDLERILAAVSAGSLVALAIWTAGLVAHGTWATTVPKTFWLAEMVLSLAILGGVRFGIRVGSDWRPAVVRTGARDARATLLYGAGHVGARMARSAFRDPDAGVVPVGFLDDDPTLAGRLRRRGPGVRRDRRPRASGRRDGCPVPSHHDAERARQRGPAGRGCRCGDPPARSGPCRR